jgi:hypothetical protein
MRKQMRSVSIFVFLSLFTVQAQKFRPDDPREFEPQAPSINDATRRKLSDYYDLFSHTLSTP